MNLKTYYIPYSHSLLPLELPEHRVVFEADLPALEPMHDWKERLVQKLDAPTAGAPLCSLLSPKQHIVLLVEDNTRHTPVKEILPILCDYLCAHGCALSQIEILIAPGTHRVMTEDELWEKLGPFAMEHLKISQHDYRDASSLVTLESVSRQRYRDPGQREPDCGGG